jgi:hypothetical protein
MIVKETIYQAISEITTNCTAYFDLLEKCEGKHFIYLL